MKKSFEAITQRSSCINTNSYTLEGLLEMSGMCSLIILVENSKKLDAFASTKISACLIARFSFCFEIKFVDMLEYTIMFLLHNHTFKLILRT